MKPQTLARWVLPVWVAGIYSTLSLARVVSNWLRDRGLLRYTVAAVFAVALGGLLVALLRQARFRSWKLGVVLLGVAALGVLVALPSDTPEERLHLVEYGGLALVWHAALPERWRGWRRWLGAVLATTAVGWGDELIQGLLPTRHYDLHDVGLNAASGAWALLGKAAAEAWMPAAGPTSDAEPSVSRR